MFPRCPVIFCLWLSILLTNLAECILTSNVQLTAYATHFTYENTDLKLKPYDEFSVNDSSECAFRCSMAPQCQAMSLGSNSRCRLYDQSQCTHDKVLLVDVKGTRLYEKRTLNNGDRSVDVPECLRKCLQRNEGDCGKCGRPQYGGENCEKTCPAPWKINPTTNECYKASENAVTSYLRADQACKKEGGLLASDSSQAIHNFIRNKLPKKQYIIELTDQTKEGDWRNSDGSNTTEFSAWALGEPTGINTDCVAYDTKQYRLCVSLADCDTPADWLCSFPKGSSECTNRNFSCVVHNREPMTFYEAVGDCKSKGGKLSTISDVDEWDDARYWTNEVVSADAVIFLGHRKPAGTSNEINEIRDCPEGDMGEISSFLVTGLPNEWYDIGNETDNIGDCVALKPRPVYQWQDYSCRTQSRYICEYQLRDELDTCPYATYFYKGYSYCVKVSNDVAMYSNAEKACAKDGGRLIVIKNSPQHVFFQWLMYKNRSDTFTRCYIGLTDRSEEGTFVWSDGTSWSMNENVFSRFKYGFPNGYNKNCAILNTSGKWSSISCDLLEANTYALCARSVRERPALASDGSG